MYNYRPYRRLHLHVYQWIKYRAGVEAEFFCGNPKVKEPLNFMTTDLFLNTVVSSRCGVCLEAMNDKGTTQGLKDYQ